VIESLLDLLSLQAGNPILIVDNNPSIAFRSSAVNLAVLSDAFGATFAILRGW
jgi:hypothetical protein